MRLLNFQLQFDSNLGTNCQNTFYYLFEVFSPIEKYLIMVFERVVKILFKKETQDVCLKKLNLKWHLSV